MVIPPQWLSPLYVIVNIEAHPDPIEFARSLWQGKVSLLQLRSKNLDENSLTLVTQEIIKARTLDRIKCTIIVNDYPSVCARTDADGVHVGQNDCPASQVRNNLGPDKIIGQSMHTLDDILAAPIDILNYAALGPIFLSSTKQGHANIVGLKNLEKWRSNIQLPLVAIGGISTTNATQVFSAGADCVAVINDMQNTDSIYAKVTLYQSAYNTIQNGYIV